MSTTLLTANPALTKHASLTGLLREQIVTGELQPGDRLPSFSELRSQYGIAPATIEKVLTSLENEGLVKRLHGKGVFVSPKKPALKCVGFLSSEGGSPGWGVYWSHLMEGLQTGAHAAGYDIMLLGYDSYATCHEKVDGVILHSMQLEAQARYQMPAARVAVLSQIPGVASVSSDDFGGVYQATKYLGELGHRRIAYLIGDAIWPKHMRLMGYHTALEEMQIQLDEKWVRVFHGPNMRELGRTWMRDWLDTNWKELGCTALLCNNDEVALGAMETLAERGIRVPEDLSIIGFDGTILAETAHPKLTTIEVPLREIGLRAVALLIEQIESGKTDATSLSLPTTLKLGGSTGRLAK